MILNDMQSLCYYYDRKRDGHCSLFSCYLSPPGGGEWQDRAVAARQVHTLKVVGSNPTPATSELLTLVSKRIKRISSAFLGISESRHSAGYARAQQGTTCDCAPVVPIGRQLLSLLFTQNLRMPARGFCVCMRFYEKSL